MCFRDIHLSDINPKFKTMTIFFFVNWSVRMNAYSKVAIAAFVNCNHL